MRCEVYYYYYNCFITTVLTGKKVLGSSAGHGKGKATKGSSSTANAAITSTSASNRGQKRKSDLTQEDDESLDHDKNPPAKRGKALPAAKQHTVSRRLEGVMVPANCRITKKRTSEDAEMTQEDDPKSPVPSKKAKIGLNAKSKGAPIRRTGKSILFSA